MPGLGNSICRDEKGLNGVCELSKGGEIDLLLAIAQSLGGVWMHFDEQSVSPHGHRAAAKAITRSARPHP